MPSTTQRRAIDRTRRARYYWDRYALTLADLDAFLVVQDQQCRDCSRALDEFTMLCVLTDSEGVPQGIVCRPCLTVATRPHLKTRRNRTYSGRRVPRQSAEPPSEHVR